MQTKHSKSPLPMRRNQSKFCDKYLSIALITLLLLLLSVLTQLIQMVNSPGAEREEIYHYPLAALLHTKDLPEPKPTPCDGLCSNSRFHLPNECMYIHCKTTETVQRIQILNRMSPSMSQMAHITRVLYEETRMAVKTLLCQPPKVEHPFFTSTLAKTNT